MPLVLSDPKTVVLDQAKIVSFQISVAPELSVMVNYAMGAAGSSAFVRYGAEVFDKDAIAEVDPEGEITESLKAALYQLLAKRLGPGEVT